MRPVAAVLLLVACGPTMELDAGDPPKPVDAGRDAGVVDAGHVTHDAGTHDAGSPMLQVTVSYDYAPAPLCQAGCNHQAPPLLRCDFSVYMTRAKWAAIEANYGRCIISSPDAYSVALDCSGWCTTMSQYCTDAGAGSDTLCWMCGVPIGAPQLACGWAP